MPGKPLRRLAQQLRANHGIVLIPTFDSAIECGTVLFRRRSTDIDAVGHVRRYLKRSMPKVTGPTPCLLAEFKRSHDLGLGALAEVPMPQAAVTELSARAKVARAVEMAGNFDSPVTYAIDLMELEDAIEAVPGLWDSNLGQRLKQLRARVVFQVFKARLSFTFKSSGGGGANVRAEAGKLANIGIGSEWQWRNEATLETKKELVVAVQSARYVRVRKRFKPKVF